MNTRILMIISALIMGLVGLACTFLPHEILHAVALPSTEPAPLILQLTGALYLGFAFMNWMAKAVLIGGIYARPLAIGNFFHFMVGSFALFKAAGFVSEPNIFWIFTLVYFLLATSFGLVLFRHPLKVTAP